MPFLASLATIGRVLVIALAVVYLFSEILTLVGSGLPGFFDGSVQFNSPNGVAVDSAGNVYVADSTNQRIRKITPAGVVTTIAGNGTVGSTDGTGTNATFNNPWGIAVDSAGTLYVADRSNHVIRKITPDGVVTTLAGSGGISFVDGTGTNATFNLPLGVAVDSAGNVYVADRSNHVIRKITPAGVVTTLAGNGTDGTSGGTGTNAFFTQPTGVAVDSIGNVYVTEQNHRIRKITPEGVVTVFAGSTTSGSNDGTGTDATFRNPQGVAVDSAGNVYVAERFNNRIRKITPAGVVTTIAGNGTVGSTDGTGTNATFNDPWGIAVDSAGTLYVADTVNNLIRKISPSGSVTTLAGIGVAGFTDSVQPAQFNSLIGIAVDSTGVVYVTDTDNNCIRRITPAGVVTTLAGTNTFGYADGTGINARFFSPRGITIATNGDMYVTDTINNRIRKVTPTGLVTTFAGNDTGTSVNATGTNATFNNPYTLTFDSVGFLYIAESAGHLIRKITPEGVVTTFAGSGTGQFGDGIGTTASFNQPRGIAVDSAGNVYVGDSANNRIRKITPGGVVTTLAGQTTAGSTDGTGTSATFSAPQGVAVDSVGNLYVADASNSRIRKITPDGVVTTLAGSSYGYLDGTGTNAQFRQLLSLTVDSAGTLYVADFNNDRVRKVTPTGVVTTLAGSGTRGYSDGGWFANPVGLATDWDGTMYLADTNNHRIRKITSTGVVSTFAGSGTAGFADGTGVSATFNTPIGITVDPLNTVYVSDIGNHNIRRITSGGVVTSFAGSRTATFADGVGTNAAFNTPSGVVADIYGNVYVADTNNHRIRRITSDGTVITLAGSTAGYLDGIGTNSQFNFPYHISIDALGTLYVADQTNNRIRTVQTSTGVVSTLAGDGTAGFTPSRFNTPQGITVDRFRNAYVGDTGNHSIRKIPNVYTVPEINSVVTTLAGDPGFVGSVNGNGIGARFNTPLAITLDSVGNFYVSESTVNPRIRRITPAGVVTTFAGSGTLGFLDGTGVGATFRAIRGLKVGSDGNVYVADTDNRRIRRITPAGVVTTFAGSANAGSTDGTGTNATFFNPWGLDIDSTGNLYVSDNGVNNIRKITPAGVVTTLAGGTTPGYLDATGTNARFREPRGITVDIYGNVYVADFQGPNNRIRRITPAGVVTTFAGNGVVGHADGTGTNANFSYPVGVTVDSFGNVYVVEETNHRIRKITPAGVVTTLAGNGTGLGTNTGAFANGVGTNASFSSPDDITIDLARGVLYVADSSTIRKIGTTVAQVPLNRGVVTTIAGNGGTTFTNGTGTNATFNVPTGIAVDSVGNIYVSEQNNNRIRRITTAGVVSTLAGSGTGQFADGSGAAASFWFPYGVAVDSAGNVYVADTDNHRIRKITPGGVVTTLAGSGTGQFADGTGSAASFFYPHGIAVDSAGIVYVSDKLNHRIRRITSAGVVTTLAGSATAGSSNQTGTNATFRNPEGIAVDSAGNLYVGDRNNDLIRKITPEGVVTTLAGSTQGSVDGTGTNAMFSNPAGLALDLIGNIYVCDQSNNIVRKITPAGVVTTLAGNGGTTFANGTGTSATFNQPWGVAVDSGGIVYVADSSNHRIRKIQ